MKSDAFVEGVHERSREKLEAAFHPDARFVSPVVFKPYEGREAVLAVVADSALNVFGEDFRYVHRLENDEVATLIFTATVGGRQVDGLDLLTFDADGLITELKVMVRPLSGMMAVKEAMEARFQEIGLAPPAG